MTALPLEQRIAAALSADDIRSAVLATLIAETETAIVAADAHANEARERAHDPALSPNLAAARATMEDAQFASRRLKTLLPRLQQRFAKVSAQETYDAWVVEHERVKHKVDDAAQELRDTYQQLAPRLVELLLRIEKIDAECRRVNNSKPVHAEAANGDGKWLQPVELHARGLANFGHSESIMRDLHLPAWEAGARPLWPPYRNVGVELVMMRAQMSQQAGDPRLTTAEWWKVQEDAERQRAEDAARREREEAERRASMPVPAHSDWGEKWEREAAARAARARP
jgi:hypothetical protein